MNDVISSLRNLYASYIFRSRPESKSSFKLSNSDKLRWLGGMEVLLICLGKLQSGMPCIYQTERKKFLFINYESKETHEQHILRMCKEFFNG